MPIKYIPPSAADKQLQKVVFSDNSLLVEYAIAHRKKANLQALVLKAQNKEELGAILQVLLAIKQGQQVSPQQIPQSLKQLGYFNAQGQTQGNFTKTLQDKNNRPHIEIFLNNAVFVMNENGLAYINSEGATLDQQLQQHCAESWLTFYEKPGDAQQKQRLIKQSAHFHKDIKQQAGAHESVDWALANSAILSRNIHADELIFKGAKPMSRQQLVASINGQPDPRDPRVCFNLEYRNERQDEQKWQARQQQLDAARKQHGLFHEDAVNKTNQAQNDGQIHAFRQKPEYARIEVLLSEPPEYQAGEDLNQFNTIRQNGMKNEFELKADTLIVKSSGGALTYSERFTRMAEDVQATLAQASGQVALPISLDGIEPASKQAECRAAFEKIFGVGNVQINNQNNAPSVGPNSIVAAPLT